MHFTITALSKCYILIPTGGDKARALVCSGIWNRSAKPPSCLRRPTNQIFRCSRSLPNPGSCRAESFTIWMRETRRYCTSSDSGKTEAPALHVLTHKPPENILFLGRACRTPPVRGQDRVHLSDL